METTAASRGSIGWLLRYGATQAAWDGTERFEALLKRAQTAGGVDAAAAAVEGGIEGGYTTATQSERTTAAGGDGAGASAFYTARSAGPVMKDGPAYLLVSGLFGQYYPCYLWNVREHFQQRGAEVRISTAADGEGGVGANAAALCREIMDYHARFT
jgi:hypothetical protein